MSPGDRSPSPVSADSQRQGGDSGALSAACVCDGPSRNVNVDGNAGHSPGCPSNPHNLPHNLTHCAGCDLPFDAPMLDPGCDPYGEYVCEGCHG